MNKIERIKAAISGEKVDKLPYAFWSHLPGIDLDPVRLAKETYNFYKKYDIDFVKTMNNGMYSIEDFGCKVDYSQVPLGGVAKIIDTPISCGDDWENIKAVKITEGSLARELYSLELLLDMLKNENVPVVFTAFSPLTTAEKLSSKMIRKHIEEGKGGLIHKALEEITKTTCELVKKAIDMGASGIFFASQLTTFDEMTEKEYLEYGKPYDLKVLEAASKGWFNIVHAHGNNIMFDILKDYPVQVFNWHAWETLPEVEEAKDLTHKCLMGGIKRMDITNCNKNEVRNQIYKSIKILNRKNHILTPGCVIRYPLNEEMLKFVKITKDEIENNLS
ncbi:MULTISPECIES: uroporphyrinogen decarboxylase family protein [Fusobacterium]|uniref:uroporphyrinogen decarboxylase family protein n=1 Tax=Fusobacterium TaxID=848 RepID=UPI001477026A|nr:MULTISPECIES: uroporphyrinogen decarboxylase family protein [Fusobacterium]NME36295.1 uroporphyrinogen decarboxylase [Fusobacterium sp. FSA-380-WT-3A]